MRSTAANLHVVCLGDKVLSSVRVYAEQRGLAFFLYEKHLAMKILQRAHPGRANGHHWRRDGA